MSSDSTWQAMDTETWLESAVPNSFLLLAAPNPAIPNSTWHMSRRSLVEDFVPTDVWEQELS